MALILFLSALLVGAAVVRWLRLPLYPFEAAALTIVIATPIAQVAASSWLAARR